MPAGGRERPQTEIPLLPIRVSLQSEGEGIEGKEESVL